MNLDVSSLSTEKTGNQRGVTLPCNTINSTYPAITRHTRLTHTLSAHTITLSKRGVRRQGEPVLAGIRSTEFTCLSSTEEVYIYIRYLVPNRYRSSALGVFTSFFVSGVFSIIVGICTYVIVVLIVFAHY